MKRHLSSRLKFGNVNRTSEWFVPVTFLDKDNNKIDSREILLANGFSITGLARDKRFYEAIPPTNWLRYPVDETHEIYNDKHECVFTQILEGHFLTDGKVYWKASEDYAYETS